MKWLIASDLHGSAPCCQALLAAFRRERADKLLLLGDLLYHGPRNDLPEGYAPKQVISLLNAVKDSIFCVRGNCEAEVDQMVLDFPVLAEYCLLEAAGRLIFAAHGHHHNLQSPPPLKPGDVLLHGHTHIPAKDNSAGFWYLNPGSVSLPKGGNPASYGILDGTVFAIFDFEGGKLAEIEL